MTHSIDEIVSTAISRRASDIHIGCGIPIKLRIDGSLCDYDEAVVTAEECEQYASQIYGKSAPLGETGELDIARCFADGVRCRINFFRERGHISTAIRILNKSIPTYDRLGLPAVVNQLVELKRGLILVTGQAGSGKSTTLAYMIDQINKNQCKHIVTLEDPVEYLHESNKSIVSQREVGIDTASFSDALSAVLREDPDVIMIGELRSLKEIEAALTIAETGHLVLATLHTNSAAETVDRIVDVFPAQQQAQVRLQLSMTLNAVICQQLIPHICGKGRVLATEVMMMNGAISNLIREGKTPQIENTIATSYDIGSHLMDNSIVSLYKQCKITRDDALRCSHNIDLVRKSVR